MNSVPIPYYLCWSDRIYEVADDVYEGMLLCVILSHDAEFTYTKRTDLSVILVEDWNRKRYAPACLQTLQTILNQTAWIF